MGSTATQYYSTTGVAGGAVNAAILASYKAGQETAAAERMIKFWQNSANNKLYQDWLGGVPEGAFYKGGIYNDAPLDTFLESELADIGKMQRLVDVGLTNVQDGTYVDMLSETLNSNLKDVIKGEFSYAGFFPPAESMGTSWFDGGAVWQTDIISAIN